MRADGDTTSRSISSDAASPVSEGDTVADKYRVDRVLGQGGMGIIVAATHMRLGERVALKFLRAKMRRTEYESRFVQEARAAARLKGAHVVRVHDVGEHQGTPYMVMELLEGRDLAEYVRGGALSVPLAAELVIQACEGVAEAHASGIVHRDLKPENIFLVEAPGGLPHVKVLDFGISKAALTSQLGGDLGSRHETRSLMGSPEYMSPEQLRSTHDVDHRADVWSLGVVLFELLSGETPFSGHSTLPSLVAAVLESPHRRVEALAPDLPAALVDVVDRALAKDPAARFQTAAELALALTPFAPSRSRAVADRALRVTRASPLGELVRGIDDVTSMAPPSGLRISLDGIPLAPRMPTPASLGLEAETVAPPGSDGRGSDVRPISVTTHGASLSVNGSSQAMRGRKLGTALGALVVGALLVGAALWWGRSASPPHESAASAVELASSVVVSASAPMPMPALDAPTSAPVAAPSAAPYPPRPARPATPPRAPTRAAPTARPKPSPLDIRLER